jgi:hypothetical protein
MSTLEWNASPTGERSKCGRFCVARLSTGGWVAFMTGREEGYVPTRDTFDEAGAKARCEEWAEVIRTHERHRPFELNREQTEAVLMLAARNPVVAHCIREFRQNLLSIGDALVRALRAVVEQNSRLIQGAVDRANFGTPPFGLEMLHAMRKDMVAESSNYNYAAAVNGFSRGRLITLPAGADLEANDPVALGPDGKVYPVKTGRLGQPVDLLFGPSPEQLAADAAALHEAGRKAGMERERKIWDRFLADSSDAPIIVPAEPQ